MARHELPRTDLLSRIALGAGLAVLLLGWVVSLHLHAARSGGGLLFSLSPDACRLRACAPALERAIHTTMADHIPDRRERRALVRWIRHGARMDAYFGEPSWILARRCQTCHGASPKGGVRLLTYGDALALAQPPGPRSHDPYGRLRHLHVHLFAVGAVLFLLLLGLSRSRLPRPVVLGVGLTPVAALLVGSGLSLWGCALPGGPVMLWVCEGLVVLGWPAGVVLLAWDLLSR